MEYTVHVSNWGHFERECRFLVVETYDNSCENILENGNSDKN